jgi:hypothetical protein
MPASPAIHCHGTISCAPDAWCDHHPQLGNVPNLLHAPASLMQLAPRAAWQPGGGSRWGGRDRAGVNGRTAGIGTLLRTQSESDETDQSRSCLSFSLSAGQLGSHTCPPLSVLIQAGFPPAPQRLSTTTGSTSPATAPITAQHSHPTDANHAHKLQQTPHLYSAFLQASTRTPSTRTRR